MGTGKNYNKMKFTIDTVAKTIEISEGVNIRDLLNEIRIIPDWEDYDLIVQSEFVYSLS